MKIVMYHYVRDFNKSDYPKIKGLDIKGFKFQINYLASKFDILSPTDVHNIIRKKQTFSKKFCWLNFDDGFIDHYKYVLPVLEKHKIKATFYPPVKTTLNKGTLDVHKIHHILACYDNKELLLNEIKSLYLKFTNKNLSSLNRILAKIDTTSRLDNKNVILIKRLLQYALPDKIRKKICKEIFKKYVGEDEKSFSKKLYMNIKHLKEMKNLSHEIGVHGYNHSWLNKLDMKKQEREITRSVSFWKDNKIFKNSEFTMCYPYGAYNSDTLKILKLKTKCIAGVTTVPKTVPLKNYKIFKLPRFDTNDFPSK